MYSFTISSVMVPELTARYPRAQKCRPQNFFLRSSKLLKEYSGAYSL